MSGARQRRRDAAAERRYLVQLLCARDGDGENGRYTARIRPWSARGLSRSTTMERLFADECELIAAINPLLPRGSDVRDVFEHIESPCGFFYLLRLSSKQAAALGWRCEGSPEGRE